MSSGSNFWRRAWGAVTRIGKKAGRVREAFAGASFGRLTSDWIFAGRRSADQELQRELRILRERARELTRNSPFMAAYAQLVAENVIGPSGIRLQSKATTKDGKPYDDANDAIETAFAAWSQPEHCDARKSNTLTELLNLAVSSWPTEGEILMRFVRGNDRTPYGLQIQLLDPDLLDDLYNQNPMNGLPAIRQGVELDDYGAPVAYHLWTRHPNETGDRKRIRVAAADVLHIFIATRIGQSRGVPWATPVLNSLKMLDGYYEAALVASRMAAAAPWAIEIPDPEKAPGVDANQRTVESLELQPGTGLRLNPGETLNAPAPAHPTATFPTFVRTLLLAISSGLRISYGTLTGDLTGANYGSMRVGMLAERDHWKRLTNFIIAHALRRIYREWIAAALLNGQVPGIADGSPARWLNVSWQSRGFDWIDPLKDVQGDLIEVAAGINTLTRMASERGRDLEEVVDERKAELDMFKEMGVTSTLATQLTGIAAPSGDAAAADGEPADAGADAGAKSLTLLPTGTHK